MTLPTAKALLYGLNFPLGPSLFLEKQLLLGAGAPSQKSNKRLRYFGKTENQTQRELKAWGKCLLFTSD